MCVCVRAYTHNLCIQVFRVIHACLGTNKAVHCVLVDVVFLNYNTVYFYV